MMLVVVILRFWFGSILVFGVMFCVMWVFLVYWWVMIWVVGSGCLIGGVSCCLNRCLVCWKMLCVGFVNRWVVGMVLCRRLLFGLLVVMLVVLMWFRFGVRWCRVRVMVCCNGCCRVFVVVFMLVL